MNTTGTLHNAEVRNGETLITFQVDSDSGIVELMGGKKLSIKAELYRSKRSLNANAYMWVLIGELAKVINEPRIEIYRQAIMDAGVMKPLVTKTELAQEVIKALTDTKPTGTGDFAIAGNNKNGWTEIYLYIGSSKYNTKEMSMLIDYIVEECKEQGIDTKTPEEIADLLARWENAE